MKKIIFILAAVLFSLQTTDINARPLSQTTQLTSTTALIELTAQDITNYLISNGYTVWEVWHITGTPNWGAYTTKRGVNYQTTVYTNNCSIIGHEDSPM
jgi:hypothetical protein